MLRSKLRKARKVKGWTQKMLAEKSGIAQPVIAKYELGHHPSPKNLAKLCEALDLSVEYFNGTIGKEASVQFDEAHFEIMLKRTKRLSIPNKIMVSTVLARAFYFQDIEDANSK